MSILFTVVVPALSFVWGYLHIFAVKSVNISRKYRSKPVNVNPIFMYLHKRGRPFFFRAGSSLLGSL